MFKIIIRSSRTNNQIKKMFYESEIEFRRQMVRHIRKYPMYTVIGYELVGLNPSIWEIRT